MCPELPGAQNLLKGHEPGMAGVAQATGHAPEDLVMGTDGARQPREVAPGREFSALQAAFLPSCFSGLCGNVALLRGKRLSGPQASRESSHRRRRLQAPRAHLFRTNFDFSPWCCGLSEPGTGRDV